MLRQGRGKIRHHAFLRAQRKAERGDEAADLGGIRFANRCDLEAIGMHLQVADRQRLLVTVAVEGFVEHAGLFERRVVSRPRAEEPWVIAEKRQQGSAFRRPDGMAQGELLEVGQCQLLFLAGRGDRREGLRQQGHVLQQPGGGIALRRAEVI